MTRGKQRVLRRFWPGRVLTKRRARRLLISLGLLLLVYIYVGGDEGLFRIWSLSRQEKALEREIRRLQVEGADLDRTIDLMQTDTAYIERYAREVLGMAKEGEIIYRFVPEER